MAPIPINVLLVDDDEDTHFLVRDLLGDIEDRDFRITWLPKYDAVIPYIRQSACDICLVDYYLGVHNGLDLIRELTKSGVEIPMILLTGRGDREIDLAAMEAGAVDYLPKDQMTGEVLDRTIRYAIRRKRDEVANKTLGKQLIQAQKLDALGQLAGGVAHDFNNLLAVIKGNAEMLLDALAKDDPNREEVSEICQASERATELTRQLLAFSRNQIFQSLPFVLNDVVTQSGKMLKRLMSESVEMVIQLAKSHTLIKADPSQIDQVVMNLAINARDAMPNGGTLTIATTNTVFSEDTATDTTIIPAGKYVMLSVKDTGTGISQEIKSHIFEPFFTTKEKDKGTGLGLATVHGIVSQSGGYIRVCSEVGHGTTFEAYFPECSEDLHSSSHSEDKKAPSGGVETLLVAEDDPAVRSLVVKTLKRQGYTVLQSENGADALRVANEYAHPIHLLLTDVRMPKLGGLDLAEKMKALRSNIKVIFLSAYCGDAVLNERLQDPTLVLIQKPFSPSVLAERVRAVLDEICLVEVISSRVDLEQR